MEKETLPISKISLWSNEKLLQVIKSGESINWDSQLAESDEEWECYIECLYSEKEKRKI